MNFSDLPLSKPTLKALKSAGFAKLTPIQSASLPVILEGRDLLGIAQTGSGKTLCYALPAIEAARLGVKSLILVPTRELAQQVNDTICSLSGPNVTQAAVYGGIGSASQLKKITQGVDILTATPGRLLELMKLAPRKPFSSIQMAILDEADQMLSLGFIHDLKKILSQLAPNRQTVMLSATLSPGIETLAKELLKQPKVLRPKAKPRDNIEEIVCLTSKEQKIDITFDSMASYLWKRVLILTNTKQQARNVATSLSNKGISALVFEADQTQGARQRALEGLKKASIRAVVATDLAARGLHIGPLECVINYDFPRTLESYIHRKGRVGRDGEKAYMIHLVSPEEIEAVQSIENSIGYSLKRQSQS